MTNQKIKADAGKPKVSLVPSQIIYDIARVREYGNNKYPEGGPNNWKDVEKERYRDAAYRHLLAYIEHPHDVDAESGLPHLWHLACNVAFLCELEKNAVWIRRAVPILKTKGTKPLPPKKKSLKSKNTRSKIVEISTVSRHTIRRIKWLISKIFS